MWQIGCAENVLVCGSTRSGKTKFVENLLDSKDIWKCKMDKIIYCYGIHNSAVDRLSLKHPDITLIEGMVDLSQPRQLFSPSENNLFITDDNFLLTQNSRDFTNFITRGTSHCHCTCISIEHGLFSEGKERRTQSHHWDQYILFKNHRSLGQLGVLAKQLSIAVPTMQYAYEDAVMNRDYGYLIVDCRLDTPPELKLITNVLSENDNPPYVYL